MWNIVFSTLAAAFGVQSAKQLEEDEKRDSIAPYLLAGLVFTILFAGSLILMVNWITL